MLPRKPTATRSCASVSLLMRYCNSTPSGSKSFVTVNSPADFRYVRPGPSKPTCCPNVRGGSPPAKLCHFGLFPAPQRVQPGLPRPLQCGFADETWMANAACCDASIGQPRQALDQLFIRIKNIVAGWLKIVEIFEFERLRGRNGRTGCADGHRLPLLRPKHINVMSAQQPPDLKTFS
jgi:hypothetical protein